IRLPVLSVAGAQPEVELDRAAVATPRRRVLVADDNRDAALSLAMMLEMIGNETQTAFDGLEAVEVAGKFLPDVMLLDIGMPKLSGHEAAARIRQQPWGRNIVLVALTGWGQDPVLDPCLEHLEQVVLLVDDRAVDAVAERIRPVATAAVRHPRDHEQPIEALELLEAAVAALAVPLAAQDVADTAVVVDAVH